ncbi:four helix bundle protein [Maribacter sp. 2210JD10-5]|uniref:four helix bundle protein n=1 Tax=Maribacter sp. 2210JD10-5 TaxID=3386272 RepID=UPI0039BD3F1F
MDYTELEVWKESRKLVSGMYMVTKSFPKDELYGLTGQMRRCAVSIPSNIAEGCGRRTSADTVQFLHISKGSLYELETQLFLALDQNYLDGESFKNQITQITLCKKLLSGFIKYFKNKK